MAIEKTAEPRKQVNKQTAKTPNELQRSKSREHLRTMIAAGRDRVEVSLMTVIKELLDDLHHDDGSSSLSPKKKDQRRSLSWNVLEVKLALLESHPDSWFFDPIVHRYVQSYRHYLGERLELDSEIDMPLRRRPKLRKRFRIANVRHPQMNETIEVATGFLLGLNAYQRVLRKNLDGMNLFQLKEHTIKYPWPEPEQKATGTD